MHRHRQYINTIFCCMVFFPSSRRYILLFCLHMTNTRCVCVCVLVRCATHTKIHHLKPLKMHFHISMRYTHRSVIDRSHFNQCTFSSLFLSEIMNTYKYNGLSSTQIASKRKRERAASTYDVAKVKTKTGE